MKFLFVLDSVEFPLAPTPALARHVAGLLAQRGHTVHLLELWDGETPPPTEKDCAHTLVRFSDERVMNRVLEFGRTGGTPMPRRLAKLCLHPAAALAALRQIALHQPRRVSAARKAIEKLDKAHSFDVITAVAAPYAGSFALEKARVNAKKISWQMDPYAANRSYSAPGSWQREKELLAALDGVLVPPDMAGAYRERGPLSAFSDRMQVQDFPSLVRPEEKAGKSESPLAGSAASCKEEEPLRCVFVGSLYPGLRTPHFALELFKALNAPNVQLVLVGGGWENYPPDLLAPYQQALGGRLVVTGPLPHAQAAGWLCRADVLVNLGNGVSNQVPSKLFEYFAAGKPILHLAKIPDDPCLGYLSRWPLSLVLQESGGTGVETTRALSRFLLEKGRCRLDYEQARELFYENTPDRAADRFEAFGKEPQT